MKWVARLVVLAGVLVVVGCGEIPIPWTGATYLVTDAIPYMPVSYGSVFFSRTLTVDFRGTSATLSLSDDGTGNIMVDDVAVLDIRHPDGSSHQHLVDFTDGCAHAVNMLPPQQIASWLDLGTNSITFTFRDQCGGNGGSTRIYLTVK